jgi:DNA-binding CsgD family transcriptional regulator
LVSYTTHLNPDTMLNPKLEILEAAYRHGPGHVNWLSEIGQTLRRSVPAAVSCFCFEVYREDGKARISRPWAEDPVVAAEVYRLFDEFPPQIVDLFYAVPLQACTTRDILGPAGVPFESTVLPELFHEVGVAEMFAVAAIEPAGRGVVLGVGLAEPGGPSPRERVDWVHVAAHVAAARRLRVHLAGGSAIDRASAVLSPNGRIEHLAETEDADIGPIVREAVKQVEYARNRASSSTEALELWQGLVDGRWSLVEQFESDGRRFYVAVRNPSDAIKLHALTRREAEVAAYVAKGTPTKVTAYALGLDEVTVRGYLRAAMSKLGLRSRAELVALRATLEPGADALAQT